MIGLVAGWNLPELREWLDQSETRRAPDSAHGPGLYRAARARAHALATGPLRHIVDNRLCFLGVFGMLEADATLRSGLVRLVPHAMSELRKRNRDPWVRLNELYDTIGISAENAAAVAPLRVGWIRARKARGSGAKVDPRHDDEGREMIALARKFADGDFRRLVDNHATFVWIVNQYGLQDSKLVEALGKLAGFALRERGKLGADIAKHIVRAFEHNPPPNRLRVEVFRLQDFLDSWGRRDR